MLSQQTGGIIWFATLSGEKPISLFLFIFQYCWSEYIEKKGNKDKVVQPKYQKWNKKQAKNFIYQTLCALSVTTHKK